MGRCGMEVGAEVADIDRARVAAELLRPEVIVIDLAVVGFGGLRGALPTLAAVAPRSCVLVLASPAFSGLRGVAAAAGALDLVETSDLRPLERTLRQLGTIPAGCSCWMTAQRSGQPVVAEHEAHASSEPRPEADGDRPSPLPPHSSRPPRSHSPRPGGAVPPPG